MSKINHVECERNRLNRLIGFRLPHLYQRLGWIVSIAALLIIFSRLVTAEQPEVLREIGRKGLLIGMLLISLSKDKEEDELTDKLRAQSYALAFIIGVVYTLVMPLVDFGVSNALKPEGESFKDLGDFQVLVFMLMIQLMFYYTLKRAR
ncbi:MAG: hypothetical protein HKN00_12205 [Flavobacteriaceae bacterium]|nr:hypothetical protein [Bacteroidia bacterium]MBT8287478.1 hypothetical protein [Bacteroidia bacterium]NNF75943.1 hypothetical protein [Flavobacteriaceae bacterium]NNK73867.1 hypothetical protein [Flavobacteriaceae bacterium]